MFHLATGEASTEAEPPKPYFHPALGYSNQENK